jgi:signal transduction histidine kinase
MSEAERLVRYVEQGIDLTRNLARGFFSPELEADGLIVALQGLAENMREQFRINCVFQADESVQVRDSTAATQLYRIAQEAATNSVKHAAAGRIDIRLALEGQALSSPSPMMESGFQTSLWSSQKDLAFA